MKKVLAIVLTLAMLASVCVTGASAMRVFETEDITNKYWMWDADNCYAYIPGSNAVAKWEFDVAPVADTAMVSYFGNDPTINVANGTVGVGNDGFLSFGWVANQWYHVIFDALDGNGTTITIDGTEIGTVSNNIRAQWCGNPGYIKIDNFEMTTANGTVVSDFENGDWNPAQRYGDDGNGYIKEEVVDTLVLYNNNEYEEVANRYWMWDKDNCYAYIPGSDAVAKWEFDVCPVADTAMVSYFGNDPTINVANGTVGVGNDGLLSFSWTADQWYHVIFDALDGNGTTITIDGNEIGTVTRNIRAQWCGNPGYIKIDNFEMTTANGTVVSDFENGDWSPAQRYGDDGNGYIAEDYAKVDFPLGTYYYMWDADNCYAYIPGSNAVAKWEFEVCPVADTAMVSYFGNDPTINVANGTVGVGNDGLLSYNWVADQWYHIVFDALDGNGTTITINGVEIGTVSNNIRAQWCGNPGYIKIDNFAMTTANGTVVSDFENGDWNPAQRYGDDGNGYVNEYDFGAVKSSVDDMIEKSEPSGAAMLFPYSYSVGQSEDDWNLYIDLTGAATNTTDYAYNFDLALIEETDTTGAAKIQNWSNVADRRFEVGTTYTGCQISDKNTDYTEFDWGEATKDNFHNVTFAYYGKTAYIFVDGVEVYEGLAGEVWDSRYIGMLWNASAIIDNFQAFTIENNKPWTLKPIETNIPYEDYGEYKNIDLDAEDFCATNGHIEHNTVRTTPPTCTEYGTDTTYCAVCGQVAKTSPIDPIGHKWPRWNNYDSKVDPTATAAGKRTWACQNGCGLTISTALPATSEYTGEIWRFADFKDAPVVNDVLGFWKADGEIIANGIGVFESGCEQNYNEIDDIVLDTGKYSVSFDFRVDGLFDDDSSTRYGHEFYFWFGGENGIYNMAGYNFDGGYFFVRPSSGTAYEEIRKYAECRFGTWHKLTFSVLAESDEAEDVYCKIFVDGEEMISFDEWWDTAYTLPGDKSFVILRDFGVAGAIDNFAVGSYDLAFTPRYGDLNNDRKIDSRDLSLLRSYMADRISDAQIDTHLADINGDGDITVADVLALRTLLVGGTLADVRPE